MRARVSHPGARETRAKPATLALFPCSHTWCTSRVESSDWCNQPGHVDRTQLHDISCSDKQGCCRYVDTYAFLGNAPSPSSRVLVNPRLRRNGLDLVCQCAGMDRTIVDAHATHWVARSEGVLHPVRIVAVGVVLARMGAAALGAVRGRVHGNDGLSHEIVEL